MHLEINAGGLDSFFNGVSSFIGASISAATSDGLINGFQTVIDRTNGVSGGVGSLKTALNYVRVRKSIEESRKIAVQTVRAKTDDFIQTSLQVDKSVAGMVKSSQESFYQTNPWLRPPVIPTALGRFWSGNKQIASVVWNGIVSFVEDHWKELLIGLAFIVVGAIFTALTGGTFLVALGAGLKAAAIAGAISGGISTGVSVVSSVIKGESFKTAANNAISAFGDGFAGGFMFGGIMAGGSQIISGGFKIAAKLGAATGRNGGINLLKNLKILSPNSPNFFENGGTLLKIGSKFKNIRFDVGASQFLHINLQLAKTINYHIPLGMILSIIGGSSESIKDTIER